MSKKAAKRSRTASPSDTAAAEAPSFFTWLLGVSKQSFFRRYFEKEHLVCSHGSSDYFSRGVPGTVPPVDWSTARMLELAEAHTLHYGTDLNVVRFDPVLKKRVAFKTDGVVNAAELKQCMESGWSVRFLRPHEHLECNSAFIALMESEFNCYCGLNSYWTPANSQGFAPHYDDVDVFLLQMEGEKEWLLYDPLEDVDYLTRHSSEDYVPEQFPTPKHHLTLRAGDVLYMPRGMVHQGRTKPHTHSLHVTFSANQMNAWADLMLRACRHSVETLAANNIAWRRALPVSFTRTVGEMNHPDFRAASGLPALSLAQQGHRQEHTTAFRQLVSELSLLMTDEAHIDICSDMYAKDTIERMQPLSAAYGHAGLKSSLKVKPSSDVRLASRNCIRLVLNVPGEARVYHTGENSVVCLAGSLGELRFEADFAPAIATLIAQYPKSIAVTALPFPGFDDPEDIAENQLTLAETLHSAGVLEVVPHGKGKVSSPSKSP